MKNEQFLQQFGHFIDAPNGIKKLRELILQMAVQGKLVVQVPNDEPASVLLGNVIEKKDRLIAEGTLKKSKTLPITENDFFQCQLPQSWQPIFLGEIIQLISGQHLKPGEYNEKGVGLPYITGPADFGLSHPEPTRFTNSRKAIAESGDILITVKGSGIGKLNILNISEAAISRQLMAVRPIGVVSRFVYLLLSEAASHFQEQKVGIAIPGIGRDDVNKFPVGLPPLAEQHRIVAKVDELMAHCDQLEAERNARVETQQRLIRAVHHPLTEASDTTAAQTAWHRIRNNFADLYTTLESVQALRQTILQLAVQGKLVPQDSNDEPASLVVSRIASEREALVKAKTIKKRKPQSPINPGDPPYPVPDSWKWVRLADAALLSEYGTSWKSHDDATGVPVLRMGNIQGGMIAYEKLKYVDHDIDGLPKLFLQNRDILFNRTNSYELVGKSGIYVGGDNSYTFASYLIRVRLFNELLSSRFVNMAMNAPYFRETQIEPELTQQCGQANFNGTKLLNTLIPLAPTQEQHRIVAKVDELMAHCDQLEASIRNKNDTATRYADAIVQQIAAA